MLTLFKGGTIVNPIRTMFYDTTFAADILIENEQIVEVCPGIDPCKADRVIDCRGLFIMPGLIDLHCHLREPGAEQKETIETGALSAVKGGFTTICPMPNTNPVADSLEALAYLNRRALEVDLCHIHPYSSVTVGEKGRELVNFALQRAGGAVAFSDDGMPVENAKLMREAMLKANALDTFVAEHCEEKSLSSGVVNAGPVAEELHVEGILPEAEILMAARDIMLAAINHCHVHLCHVSTATTVHLVRLAKEHGVDVTCETCPHYFSFTAEEVLRSGTNAKMNPPLRTEEDRQAIIKGLQSGVIDCIATDHAPHTAAEKFQDFSHASCTAAEKAQNRAPHIVAENAQALTRAPNGIIGFETALPAAITNLVQPNHLDYPRLAQLMSYRPAKLLGLSDRGVITPGFVADLTLFDPTVTKTYDENSFVSKSKNSPWLGKELSGAVIMTVVDGNIVYEDKTEE